MGAGIMAAIPLTVVRSDRYDERYFAKGFFDNYDIENVDDKIVHVIKKDLLTSNYKSFLTEFYALIESDISVENETLDDLPDINSFDEFLEAFSSHNRNNATPFIYESRSTFSTLGCQCNQYWLFYNGSYKAILEEYSTLLHFEKILAKAMSNPLANAVKFGIFG